MKLFSILLFLGINLHPIYAQKSLHGIDKLIEAQLQLNSVPFDKDTNAVILDESGYLDVNAGGHQLVTKTKIKILNEEAIDEGNIDILVYSKDNFENIKSVKAQSFNEYGFVLDEGSDEDFCKTQSISFR